MAYSASAQNVRPIASRVQNNTNAEKSTIYICSSEEGSNKLTIYDVQLVNYTDANQFPNLVSF